MLHDEFDPKLDSDENDAECSESQVDYPMKIGLGMRNILKVSKLKTLIMENTANMIKPKLS